MSKRKPYNNADIEKAHDVRTLRCCDYCDGLGNSHSMLHLDFPGPNKVFMHGRCFIRQLGIDNFVKLPKRETNKMRLDDIGVRAMKTLLDYRSTGMTRKQIAQYNREIETAGRCGRPVHG